MSEIKGKQKQIARMCDRRFGIGADGLIIIEEDLDTDFRMVYYNSDGNESTMCGNGGRCSIAFSKLLGLAGDQTIFEAIDGKHDGAVLEDGWIELGMVDVEAVEDRANGVFVLNTGSPHFVKFQDETNQLDIVEYGRSVRFSEEYHHEGINVNLVTEMTDGIQVETYERGVENETLSCGTGVTAAAIAYYERKGRKGASSIPILTKGGKLEVRFAENDGKYSAIILAGPAVKVFEGVIDL